MKSTEARIADVKAAIAALPAAFMAAEADPTNVELWAEVERLGATVHRQGRLLAGKKRGG